MNLALTRTVVTATGVALAVWAGWELANGRLLIATVVGGFAFCATAQVATGIRIDVLAGGAAMLGFLLGNRGFAQLSAPNIPLLPAEAALGLGLVVVGWTSARQRQLPLRRDALNVAILVWMIVSTIRLPFDLRQFGFMALRDFAMVYYALFFFLAQQWGGESTRERRWLRGCLLAGLALAPLAFEAFKHWPELIVTVTSIRGIPLIYVKGDSAAALMAGGAAWCGCLAVSRGKARYAVLASALLACVILSNSRAALVALAVIGAWCVIARAWRLLRVTAAFLAAGLVVAFIAGAVSRQPWHETEIYRTYERVASMADFSGNRVYRSSILQDKGDNNDFRLTWWRIVARHTWEQDRWFGVGFGSELAAEFMRVYYPEADETFTARSPHNFALSVFARSGLVGLGAFLAVVACLAAKTWRAARQGVGHELGLWLFGWGVLVSACFGVVLEGPMGAVVFWIVLGLANAESAARARETDVESAESHAPHLPAAQTEDEFAATS